MKHITKLSLITLALASTTALAAPKTFVYCLPGSPSTFNPQFADNVASLDSSGKAMFNKLTDFEPGTTNVIPSLAEKWEISEDGKTYVFHLRKGVKFHSNKNFSPTRDFNADDVLFSFNRQADPNHPYHKVSGGNYSNFLSMDMQNIINKIEKIDDYTVKFVLNVPNAPFLANLAMEFASVLSAEYADKMLAANTPEQLDREPIGTGPFEFVSYQKDSTVRYKAFEQYWQGKATIDRLIFAITPDALVSTKRLQNNECQAVASPNPTDLETLKKDSNINLLTQSGLSIDYIAFNTQKAPFDNVKVRQALNYAVNKDTILESVYQNSGEKAKNPIPPTMWSYNDDIKDYDYNPEKAKALLAEAGFTNGFEIDIWVPSPAFSNGRRVNTRRIAELVQEDWKKVGVNTKIISYEVGGFQKRKKQGDYQVILGSWIGDNGDPDNFLNILFSCVGAEHGSNAAKFCNKDVDKLVTEASRETDKEKRTELYKQAQVIIKEQAPWVTIAHSTTYFPVRKEVKGYKVSPLSLHNFYGVDLVTE